MGGEGAQAYSSQNQCLRALAPVDVGEGCGPSMSLQTVEGLQGKVEMQLIPSSVLNSGSISVSL